MPPGLARSNSLATETSSLRFSILLSSCRSLGRLQLVPVPGLVQHGLGERGDRAAAACSRSEAISALNSAIAFAERVARSGTSSTRPSAAGSEIRSRCA